MVGTIMDIIDQDIDDGIAVAMDRKLKYKDSVLTWNN